MCRVDPEIICDECNSRMYYDDYSSEITKEKPIWKCMNCKYELEEK